jgi:hypothetical protein
VIVMSLNCKIIRVEVQGIVCVKEVGWPWPTILVYALIK